CLLGPQEASPPVTSNVEHPNPASRFDYGRTSSPHFEQQNDRRNNWTHHANRASLTRLTEAIALWDPSPAGCMPPRGLRWWRRQTPSRPMKGSPHVEQDHKDAKASPGKGAAKKPAA